MPVSRRPRRARFLMASCFTVALALEVGVRIESSLDGDVPPAVDESLEKEWQWAEKHLAQGTAIVPSRFVYDPFVGWRNRPDVRSDGLTTNAAGMRGSKEYSLERRTDLRRLVLVGDSYTFGDSVRDEETFGHLLDGGGLLEGWEVLNMAVSGTGTDQQTLEFEHYGSRYHPDVVVLGFFVRDYNRNVLSFRDYAKPVFVVDAGVAPDGLRLTGSPVIAPEALYASYASGERRIGGSLLRPRALAAFHSIVRGMEEWSVGPGVPAWEVLSRLMARFQRVVRESGATPVWLVIPNRDCIEPGRSKMVALEEACERRARELGLACLRLDEAFRAHAAANPQDAIYHEAAAGGHLSGVGNRIVADELAQLLSRLGDAAVR